MRILVVGANGLLGSNLVSAADAVGALAAGTHHTTTPALPGPHHQLDIRDTDRFEDVLAGSAPDVAVNCAAMTAVDGCEEQPERARTINAVAPGELASACAAADVEFVQISTDYVFAGTANRPYGEEDPPDPLQVYGETKLAGERTVRAAHDESLVVRLSFVYGIHRATGSVSGFPAWVRSGLQSEDGVPLFTDQWVTPTRAGQAAETILSLVEQQAEGTYHVASRSCVTPHEFGEEIRTRMDGPVGSIHESSRSDPDRSATRPQYTCLDVTRVENALGRRQPALAQDLDDIERSLR